ncbi:hypothetical protein [Streptococcus sp. zg-JUN1979]|uniref:hypothetical protein n=1 Tax=Streptococcus sp. zg-JUN1979 TaxID=3391450 RepID=UPI0039A6A56F
MIRQKAPSSQNTEWLEKHQLFSRYLLFRYSIALYFFANIYWLLMQVYRTSYYMWGILVLLGVFVLAAFEQLKLYHQKLPHLKWTKCAFVSQLVVNSVILLISMSQYQYRLAFPILSTQLTGRFFIVFLQLMSYFVISYNLVRIHQIAHHKDRFYRYVQSSSRQS